MYEGEWCNGVRDGYGVQVWPDSSRYEGEWKEDKANGTAGAAQTGWRRGPEEAAAELHAADGGHAPVGTTDEGGKKAAQGPADFDLLIYSYTVALPGTGITGIPVPVPVALPVQFS